MKRKFNNKVVVKYFKEIIIGIKPLKIGAILKTPNPPIVIIWPNDNSIRNMGTPASARAIK